MAYDLNTLMKEIDSVVADFSKKASMEEPAIESDVQVKSDSEMEDGYAEEPDPESESVDPVTEAYEEGAVDEYNLDSSSQKAARLAEQILRHYKKAAETSCGKKPAPPKQEAPKKQPMKEDEKEVKKAFLQQVQTEGAPFLHKIAELIDPDYSTIVSYNAGATLADHENNMHKQAMMNKQASFQKQAQQDYIAGARAAEMAIQQVSGMNKQAALQKQAQQDYIAGARAAEIAIQRVNQQNGMNKQAALQKEAQDSYIAGANLAEMVIRKVAADLTQVQPVLNDLKESGSLSQAEEEALVAALSAADKLTPELIKEVTGGMTNADIIANALIKILEGDSGEGEVPTDPVAYAAMTEQKLSPEEEIVVQAAKKIIQKKKSMAKRRR